MDMCHLKNLLCEPKFPKVQKGVVVLRGDIVKDDSGSHACTYGAGFVSITDDGRRNLWMLWQDSQGAEDEQLMQCQLSPRSARRTLQHC